MSGLKGKKRGGKGWQTALTHHLGTGKLHQSIKLAQYTARSLNCSFLQFPLAKYHSSFLPNHFIVSSLKLTPCQHTSGWAMHAFPCLRWSPTLSCLSLNSWEGVTTPGSHRDVLLEEGICPEPLSALNHSPVELPGKSRALHC